MTAAAEPDAMPEPPPPSEARPGLLARSLGRLSGNRRAGAVSLGWSGLGQVLSVGFRLISSPLLAALLSPRDFGILAPATALLGTLELFSDFGVFPSLMRHPDGMTPRYLLTGFWIGLGRGVALAAIGAAVAWPWAAMNRTPVLGPLLLTLSLRSALIALRSPALPRLRRDLNYRSLFVDEMVTLVMTTGSTLVLAWLTRSYWSLVFGGLIGAAASVAVSYVLAPCRVRWVWDRGVVAEISGLGRQVWLNTLLMAAYANVDRLFGLRLVGPQEMGYYAVAVGLSFQLDVAFSRVGDIFFSMLARQADPGTRRAWGDRATSAVSRLLMPAMALGIIAAPVVIRVLYDPRYVHVGVLFGILTARVMVRSIGQLQFEYLLTTGDIRANSLAFAVAAAAQAGLLVLLGRLYGSTGLACASLVSTLVYTSTQTLLMWLKGHARPGPLALTCLWAALGLALMFAVR